MFFVIRVEGVAIYKDLLFRFWSPLQALLGPFNQPLKKDNWFISRFLREVSSSNYVSWGNAGLGWEIQNLYLRFVDPKSEISAPMSPLFYSAFAWILRLTNLAQ